MAHSFHLQLVCDTLHCFPCLWLTASIFNWSATRCTASHDCGSQLPSSTGLRHAALLPMSVAHSFHLQLVCDTLHCFPRLWLTASIFNWSATRCTASHDCGSQLPSSTSLRHAALLPTTVAHSFHLQLVCDTLHCFPCLWLTASIFNWSATRCTASHVCGSQLPSSTGLRHAALLPMSVAHSFHLQLVCDTLHCFPCLWLTASIFNWSATRCTASHVCGSQLPSSTGLRHAALLPMSVDHSFHLQLVCDTLHCFPCLWLTASIFNWSATRCTASHVCGSQLPSSTGLRHAALLPMSVAHSFHLQLVCDTLHCFPCLWLTASIFNWSATRCTASHDCGSQLPSSTGLRHAALLPTPVAHSLHLQLVCDTLHCFPCLWLTASIFNLSATRCTASHDCGSQLPSSTGLRLAALLPMSVAHSFHLQLVCDTLHCFLRLWLAVLLQFIQAHMVFKIGTSLRQSRQPGAIHICTILSNNP